MFVTDPITGRASPVPLLLALASLGAAYLWTPDAVCAQEVPVEGCTFDATVTGFFEGSFEGRAWIGSPKAEGGALDRSDARRLHLCLGSSTSQIGCADPGGPRLFEVTLPLPEPGETGSYPTEALLHAWDRDVFRSTLVERWSTVNGPGTLELSFHEAGRQVLEHEVAALGRTYADTVYTPAARGTFRTTLVPSWREIRPNTKMAWSEGGKTFEADPEITVNVAFNAGVLRVDPSAPIGSAPSLQCTAAPRPFGILARTPDDGARNIDFEDPVVEVTFTAGLDPASVTEATVQVGYLDPQGAFVRARGELQIRGGGRTIRFVPERPLKDGVFYRVRVRGGPTGIRGRDDEHLPGDARWKFATTVDLDDRESMPGLPPILDASEGIEPHVFQVARDAYLVAEKPTLTRVYVKWKERDDVHPEWQVKKFLATVRVTAGGDPLYEEKQDVLIRRPDQYDAAARRAALNTVNFFGWRPAGDEEPAQLVVEVEPSDQTGGAGVPRIFPGRRQLSWAGTAPVLDVEYYYVAAGDWPRPKVFHSGGIPDWVKTVTPGIAQAAATFTTQNFPVRATRMRRGGVIHASTGFLPMMKGQVQTSGLLEQVPTDQLVADQVYREVGKGSDVDVILMFMSRDVQPAFNGYTYREAGDTSGPALVGVFYRIEQQQARSKMIGTVAHEIGHVYGLGHYPREKGHTDVAIEGFRIAPSGTAGWNKSSTEGNQEGSLKPFPLMREGADPYRANLISNDNYESLLKEFFPGTVTAARRSTPVRVAGDAGFGGGMGHGPSAAPSRWGRAYFTRGSGATGVSTGGTTWSVGGFAHPKGEGAIITSVRRVATTDDRSAGGAPADGSSSRNQGAFRAKLLDEAGREVASRSFSLMSSPSAEPSADSTDLRPFRVSLTAPEEVRRVVIEYQGRRIQWRDRSRHAPEVEVLAAEEAGEEIVVEWRGTDADADALVYDLHYSPDGRLFRPLALGLSGTRYAIPTSSLPPGPRPTLRVTVGDGFDRASDEHPLPSAGRFRVIATLPAGEESGGSGQGQVGERIAAIFNADVAEGSLSEESFALWEAGGERVQARLTYDDYSRTAVLIPAEPLVPDRRYAARLTADVTDLQGNPLAAPVEWSFVWSGPPLAPEGDPGDESAAGSETDADRDDRPEVSAVPKSASGEAGQDRRVEPEAAAGPWDVLARTGSGEDAGAAVAITGPLQLVFGPSGSGTVALQGTCVPAGPTILKARLGEGDGNWLMMNTPASLGTAGPGDYDVPTLQLGLADGPGAGIYQGSGQLRIEGSGSARTARLTATLPPASGGAPVELALAFSPAAACRGG